MPELRWVVVELYIYICMHTYIHTYLPTYLHTYLPTYIHTYIHLNISDASYICASQLCMRWWRRRRAHLVTVSWQITHSIIGERRASALRYARTYVTTPTRRDPWVRAAQCCADVS